MEPIHLTTATILNPAESNILEYVAWCVWNVDIYKVMAYPSYTKSKMKDATDETRMKASKRFQPRPPFSHWWMRLSPHAAKMAYYQHGMVKATKRAMLLVVLGLIWAVQSAVVTSSSSGWRNRAVVHAPNLHCKNHPEQQQQRKRGNAMIPETTAVFPTRSSHKSLSTTASSIATTAVRGGGGQLSAAAAQVRMAHGDLMACTCMTTHLLMATTSLSLNVASGRHDRCWRRCEIAATDGGRGALRHRCHHVGARAFQRDGSQWQQNVLLLLCGGATRVQCLGGIDLQSL
jgi:hypothetical protein